MQIFQDGHQDLSSQMPLLPFFAFPSSSPQEHDVIFKMM